MDLTAGLSRLVVSCCVGDEEPRDLGFGTDSPGCGVAGDVVVALSPLLGSVEPFRRFGTGGMTGFGSITRLIESFGPAADVGVVKKGSTRFFVIIVGAA